MLCGISYKSPRNQGFLNYISYYLLEVFQLQDIETFFFIISDLSAGTRCFICLFFFLRASMSALSESWPTGCVTHLAYLIALKVFVRSPPFWNVCEVAAIILALVLNVFRLNTTLGLLAY